MPLVNPALARVTLKTIDGPRMAVRVVTVPERSDVFQVQYEVAPGKWRNLSRPDGSFFYRGRLSAYAAAERCHARNN